MVPYCMIVRLSSLPSCLSEGPPEGWVAGSLLSDVLLCLASTV